MTREEQIALWRNTPLPQARRAYPGYDENAPLAPAPLTGEPLHDITDHPRIAFDASYFRRGIDGALSRCYVRQGVRLALERALERLPDDYSFLVYDTLRPYRVQHALYEEFYARVKSEHPDYGEEALASCTEEFVARPVRDLRFPSSHQSGGAVDLTLCRGGEALDMGTVFDEFAPIAHADFFEREGMDETVRANRRLLYHLMRSVGFTHYPCEWWHFDYGDGPWARRTGRDPLYSSCADGPSPA